MTTLFRGGEMDAFLPADGDVTEAVSAGRYNASFARCAIKLTGGTTFIQSPSWGNETDVWVHFDYNIDTVNAGLGAITLLELFDASGNSTYKITIDGLGGGVYRLYHYYSDGLGGYTFLGNGPDIGVDTLHTIDVHVDYSVSGGAAIYVSGTERCNHTADLSGLSGAAYLRFKSSLISYFSQVIVKDESTIGRRLLTCPPTGPGASTAWVGDYSRVDEIAYSDADFINSSTAAQDELFVHATSIPTGYVIAGVTVSNRGKKGSTGPANHRQLLRVSGTTYASGSDIALDLGYEPYQTHWDQDPSTTADWLNSTGSTLQFGARSAT